MATAADFINGALVHLTVKSAETSLQPDEIQDGLVALNDMLSSWEVSGRPLGFTRVAGIADTVNVPQWAERAIKAALAVELAPSYERIISPALAVIVSDSEKALLRTILSIGPAEYPNTMPMGSGNVCGPDDRRFFPDKGRVNF